MEGKFITLYTLPTPLAGVEAPVLISKGELLMSRFSEKLFVRIEMHSLDEREVHSVKICLMKWAHRLNLLCRFRTVR